MPSNSLPASPEWTSSETAVCRELPSAACDSGFCAIDAEWAHGHRPLRVRALCAMAINGQRDFRLQEARSALALRLGLSGIPALKQHHGCDVVHYHGASGESQEPLADACWSDRAGTACMVLSADCLPVLLASAEGSTHTPIVAAIHAGWRGLCAGIIERTIARLPLRSDRLLAWLGPAISAQAFEVGPEVRSAFLAAAPEAIDAFRPGRGDRWHGDLYLLARQRLHRAGVSPRWITGGDHCTVGNRQCASHRRDGAWAGRMASVIWHVADDEESGR